MDVVQVRDAHTDPEKILPTFIHIGPGRSATTMLYEAFKEHPEVGMAKNIKETNYFNDEYHRGEEWYQSFFKHCSGKKAIGEVSNTYIYNPKVPSRIAELLPGVRLVTVLRNPFDRIISAYAFRQRAGEISSQVTFDEAVKEYPDLITQNYYGDQLNRYLGCFPKRNLLIAFFDDLERDPEEFIRNVFAFIGVDSSFKPRAIYEYVNRAAVIRCSFLAPIVRFSADSLRRWRLYYLLNRAKSSSLLQRLLFKPRSASPETLLSGHLIDVLWDHFVPQIKEVESLTGRSLTSWYDSYRPSKSESL